MAEKVGFEPTDRVTPVNALAGRPIRPLWHFSACESMAATEETETVDESGPVTNLENGTVAEWTIAPALKADDLHGSGGSNPPRSATVMSRDIGEGSYPREGSMGCRRSRRRRRSAPIRHRRPVPAD